MNECAYCKENNTSLPIIHYDLDLGILGKAEITANLANYDDGTYIDLQVCNYGLRAKTIKKRSERIFHCPMCSRPL